MDDNLVYRQEDIDALLDELLGDDEFDLDFNAASAAFAGSTPALPMFGSGAAAAEAADDVPMMELDAGPVGTSPDAAAAAAVDAPPPPPNADRVFTALPQPAGDGLYAHKTVPIYDTLYRTAASDCSAGALSDAAQQSLRDALLTSGIRDRVQRTVSAETTFFPRNPANHTAVEQPAYFVLRVLLTALYAPFSFVNLIYRQQGRTQSGLLRALEFVRTTYYNDSTASVRGQDVPHAPHHAFYYWLMTRELKTWPWVFGFRLDPTTRQIHMDNAYFYADLAEDGSGATVYRKRKILPGDNAAWRTLETTLRQALALVAEANDNVIATSIRHACARNIIHALDGMDGQHALLRDNHVIGCVSPEIVAQFLGGTTLLRAHRSADPDAYYQRIDDTQPRFATAGHFIDHFASAWRVATGIRRSRNAPLHLPDDAEWSGWLCAPALPSDVVPADVAADRRTQIEQHTHLDYDVIERASVLPPYTARTATDALRINATARLTELNRALWTVRAISFGAITSLPDNVLHAGEVVIRTAPFHAAREKARPPNPPPEFANELYDYLYVRLSHTDPERSALFGRVLDEMRARILASDADVAALQRAAQRHALVARILAARAPPAAAGAAGADPALMVPSERVLRADADPMLAAEALFRAANVGLFDRSASPLFAWTVHALTNGQSAADALTTALYALLPVAGAVRTYRLSEPLAEQLAQRASADVRMRLFEHDAERGLVPLPGGVLPLGEAMALYSERASQWRPSAWLPALQPAELSMFGLQTAGLPAALAIAGLAGPLAAIDRHDAVARLASMLAVTVRRFNELLVAGDTAVLFTRIDNPAVSIARDDPHLVAVARLLRALGGALEAHARTVAGEVLRRSLPMVLAGSADEARALMGDGADPPVVGDDQSAMEGPGRRARGAASGDGAPPPPFAQTRKRKSTARPIGTLLRLYGSGARGLTVPHIATALGVTAAEAKDMAPQLAAEARATLSAVVTAPQNIPAAAPIAPLYALQRQHVLARNPRAALPRLVAEMIATGMPTLIVATDLGVHPGVPAAGWFFGANRHSRPWPLVVYDASILDVVSKEEVGHTTMPGEAAPGGSARPIGVSIDPERYVEWALSRPLDYRNAADGGANDVDANNVNAAVDRMLVALRPGGREGVLIRHGYPLVCEPDMRVIMLTQLGEPDMARIQVFHPSPEPDATPDFGTDLAEIEPTYALRNKIRLSWDDKRSAQPLQRSRVIVTTPFPSMHITWSVRTKGGAVESYTFHHGDASAAAAAELLIYEDPVRVGNDAPGLALSAPKTLDAVVALVLIGGPGNMDRRTFRMVVHLRGPNTVLALAPNVLRVIDGDE